MSEIKLILHPDMTKEEYASCLKTLLDAAVKEGFIAQEQVDKTMAAIQ